MLTILKLIDRTVFHVTLTLAMLLLVGMACVSFYQVITRFVFSQPSTWSEVTSRSLQIWMVYLGLVAAFRTGSLMFCRHAPGGSRPESQRARPDRMRAK